METKLHPVHPFPARMASDLVWQNLPNQRNLRILDPMAGSGTTLIVSKLLGHRVVGIDRDPLAVLIGKVWLSTIPQSKVGCAAKKTLARARLLATEISADGAYPNGADDETKEFINYWFDEETKVQLAALARAISEIRTPGMKEVLWCSLSRMIITKKIGVSLAMDVSHSRPHRKYDKAPVKPFEIFEKSAMIVGKARPCLGTAQNSFQNSQVKSGDARRTGIRSKSIDVVITSPPYLNAIDYLRGHKLSLVWMGYSIESIRQLRSTNVGAEAAHSDHFDEETDTIVDSMCTEQPPQRRRNMLRQYVDDMRQVVNEVARVLKVSGQAIFVIGDSSIGEIFVRNSACIELLASGAGLNLASRTVRPLPENKRYLPPPRLQSSGAALQKRMKEEVVLVFEKEVSA